MSIWKKIFGGKEKANIWAEYNFDLRDVNGKVMEDFAKLDADNRMRQVIILGDTANPKYFSLLQFAILTDPDIHVKFAALKRIHLFKGDPELEPMLVRMQENKTGDKLEPYFSMALSRLGIITIEEFQRKINQYSKT